MHDTLKHAGLNDIPKLMEMADTLVSNSSFNNIKMNPAKIRRELERFIVEAGRDFLCLVSYDGDEIVGVLAAYAFSPLFSDEKVAVEVFWYLDPNHRRSKRGVDMMDAFEYWAKTVGCSVAQYGLLESADRRMGSMYERRGCRRVETVYYKDL